MNIRNLRKIMSIICMFNGPPHIGKDVLAESLRFDLNLPLEQKHTLAKEVIKQASAYYKVEEIETMWNVTGFKDAFHEGLQQTPRRAVLDYSKKFTVDKPFNAICHPTYKLINSSKSDAIITDIGFQREWDTFKCLEDLGHTVVLIQLRHPDFDFSNDGRYYVEVEEKHLLTFNVTRGDIQGDSEKLLNLILERKNANSL